MEDVIKIESMSLKYKGSDSYANEEINLSIKKGSISGFYGENGAGKSTLIEAILCYQKIDRGKIYLFGKELSVTNEYEISKKISYSTQKPLPLGFMNVEDVLLITSKLRGKNKVDSEKQIEYWISKLHLENIRKKRISKLSGGQRRIVGFATALMGEYEILILDEPTNELDPDKRELVWESLQEISKTKNTTIIVITHDVNESEAFVDFAYLFSKGRLLEAGSINELKDKAGEEYSIKLKVLAHNVNVAYSALLQLGIKGEVNEENTIHVYSKRTELSEALKLISDNFKKLKLEEYTVSASNLNGVFKRLKGQGGINETI